MSKPRTGIGERARCELIRGTWSREVCVSDNMSIDVDLFLRRGQCNQAALRPKLFVKLKQMGTNTLWRLLKKVALWRFEAFSSTIRCCRCQNVSKIDENRQLAVTMLAQVFGKTHESVALKLWWMIGPNGMCFPLKFWAPTLKIRQGVAGVHPASVDETRGEI